MTEVVGSQLEPQGRWQSLSGRVMRLACNQHTLGWADQLTVSGVGFMVLLLVSAWSGIGELGTYSLCISVLALCLATQEAVISRPYTIQMYAAEDETAHAAAAMVASAGLAGSVSVLLLITAIALMFHGELADAAAAAFALAFTAPFVLLREFARRFAFANERTGSAFVLDVGVAAANLLLLGGFALVGRLNAPSAILALGLACALGFTTWLLLERRRFRPSVQGLGTAFGRSWSMGKWLLSAQICMQVQGYATHWVAMLMAGPVVTGAYAACVSVVALANPLLFGFFNIMIPKSARVFNAGGRLGLRQQAARDALLLGSMMAVFCAVIALIGEPLMVTLFPDARGYGGILVLLALASGAAAVGVPASTALATANRAAAVGVVTAGSATLNVFLVWRLMASYGLEGAAVGILVAEALGSLGRWTAFVLLVPVADPPAAPTERRTA